MPFNLFEIFEGLLFPLDFLPDKFLSFFSTVIGFFALFVAGKALKWLWDILPIA